ncbi:MAG: 5'/3'-nucleotidase SurE [Planctomycetota bacterium]
MQKPSRILLTNDDGIDAEGLQAMHRAVKETLIVAGFEDVEIVVVAPDRGRSECGHSIETSTPLTVRQRREDWYAVNGTPVDCIRVAFFALELRPDIVFSGINAGANLGVNLMVSGTFAAAREASLLGVPAFAASHYRRPEVQRTWEHTAEWLRRPTLQFLDSLEGRFRPAPAQPSAPLWNVNLPAIQPETDDQGSYRVPPTVECKVDRCPIGRRGFMGEDGQVNFELDFHNREREDDRDVQHCFAGNITISRVSPQCF